ncbi:hypothetical protein RAS1_15920 [Phycisphaerae bacterium RAS1]|nr:hypothetical protein RAS1_15920 [Phycisphaerae bacterium RAS1]
MDARKICLDAATLSFTLLAVGCEVFQPTPTPAAKPADSQPDPPQVVKAAVDKPQHAADEQVDPLVAEYIRRIDDIAGRPAPRRGGAALDMQELRRDAEILPPGDEPGEPAPAARQPIPARSEPHQPPAKQPGESATSHSEPPTVTSVAIRGDGRPLTTAPPPKSGDAPEMNAAVESRYGPTSLRDFLSRLPATSSDAPFREQLDERVLQLLAGQYEQARRPLELVSDEHRQLGERFVEALIALREAHAGDAAAGAAAVLRELEALSESLRKLSDLSIPAMALCWKVEGFGRYQTFDPPQFVAGSTAEVIVYCELRDFVSEKRDDGLYHTELGMTVNVLNRIGESVLEVRDPLIRDTCRTRRQDCFVPRLIRLPASLSAGEYTVKATVVDLLGGKVAESRTTLVVKPGL